MKYNDNGTIKDIKVKAFDTLPVGAEVDYDGTTVPDGWEEIPGGIVFPNTINIGEIVSDFSNRGLWIRNRGGKGIILSGSEISATNAQNNAYIPIEASEFRNMSDKNLKENIKNIDCEQSTKIIKSLKPVTYNYKSETKNDVRRGLIAQDVNETLDNLKIENIVCKKSKLGEQEVYLLDYIQIIPDLINTCQYLLKKVEELENKEE